MYLGAINERPLRPERCRAAFACTECRTKAFDMAYAGMLSLIHRRGRRTLWPLIRAHEVTCIDDEVEVVQCRRVQSCPTGTLKGPGCVTRTPVPSFTRTLERCSISTSPTF